MKKSKLAAGQRSTPFGGSLNIIPMTYRVSDMPIGDLEKYGYLAHVTDETRKKIMESGFGEMQLHIEHIKNSIGYIKKARAKNPHMQLGLDLGN